MEVWRDELYHALRIGSFNLPKIGIKSIGGKTTGNGEWKQHKYIRKEGDKYIYPEDLKKSTKTTSDKKSLGKANNVNKKPSLSERKAAEKYPKLTYYDSDEKSKVDARQLYKSNSGFYVPYSSNIKMIAPTGKKFRNGDTQYHMMNSSDERAAVYKYSKKKENELREAHGSDNKRTMVKRWNSPDPAGSYSDILISTVEYENGKKWFKSTIKVNSTEEHINKGNLGGVDTRTTVHYTVEYSKIRQLANKGEDFINKLLNESKKKKDSIKKAISDGKDTINSFINSISKQDDIERIRSEISKTRADKSKYVLDKNGVVQNEIEKEKRAKEYLDDKKDKRDSIYSELTEKSYDNTIHNLPGSIESAYSMAEEATSAMRIAKRNYESNKTEANKNIYDEAAKRFNDVAKAGKEITHLIDEYEKSKEEYDKALDEYKKQKLKTEKTKSNNQNTIYYLENKIDSLLNELNNMEVSWWDNMLFGKKKG